MSDAAHPMIRMLLVILLLFGPLVAFIAAQQRLRTVPRQLALAVVLALLAGFLASAAANTIGLTIQARATRVAVPTAAAFPVFFGFTIVVLGVLAFRSGSARAVHAEPTAHAAAAPAPDLRHAAAPDASTATAAPQAPARVHRRVFWILIGIYGAALLAWPLMSFGAIFAFDDPNANRLLVLYIAASIWLYPLYVIAGFLLGYTNQHPSLLVLALKTSVPLLSAIWFFLLPAIPALGLAWLTEPSLEEVVKQRARLEERLDPFYAQQAAALRGRDAAADAAEAIHRGDLALLPHTQGDDDYIGLFGTPPLDAEASRLAIERSDYLRGIEALLLHHAEHPRSRFGNSMTYDYSSYYSETLKDYLSVRQQYMSAFNTVMAQHLGTPRQP